MSKGPTTLRPALSPKICWYREDTARKINATLDRLALVMEVLQETRNGDVIPGTRGLRQGAEAALQEMLSHLARLPVEPVTLESFEIGPEEEHALSWVSGHPSSQCLPPGTGLLIQRFIQRLLPHSVF